MGYLVRYLELSRDPLFVSLMTLRGPPLQEVMVVKEVVQLVGKELRRLGVIRYKQLRLIIETQQASEIMGVLLFAMVIPLVGVQSQKACWIKQQGWTPDQRGSAYWMQHLEGLPLVVMEVPLFVARIHLAVQIPVGIVGCRFHMIETRADFRSRVEIDLLMQHGENHK